MLNYVFRQTPKWILLLTLTFCVLQSAYATVIGPVYPAPGGNDWNGSGSGGSGTATWTYSNFDTNAFDELYFGLNQTDYGPLGAGLDGTANPFYYVGVSGATAEWRSDTLWNVHNDDGNHISAITRLLITVSNPVLPWITDPFIRITFS